MNDLKSKSQQLREDSHQSWGGGNFQGMVLSALADITEALAFLLEEKEQKEGKNDNQ
jgi:hypothetical protein